MNSKIEKQFEEYYNRWKSFINNTDISEYSSDSEYVDNKYFNKIISLGEQALPYIVEKMKEDPEAHFLIHAMEKITGKRLSKKEIVEGIEKYGSPLGNQGFAKIWIEWWGKRTGR